MPASFQSPRPRSSRWRPCDLLWLLPAVLLVVAKVRVVLDSLDRTVLGTLDGADAILQSGILAWTVRHFWQPGVCVQLPIFYPSTSALVCMDSLLGQALCVAPLTVVADPTPALLYNLAVIVSLLLTAASGAALWLATSPDESPSRRAAGAGLCALLLLGSPFTAWQLGVLNQISPPWVVFLLAGLWRGWLRFADARPPGPWWWLSAGALVAQATWGWYGFADAVFVAGTAAALGGWLAWRRRRLRALLAQLAGPLAVAAVLVLALAWPYLRLRAETPEYTRELGAVQYYGAHLHVLGNAGPHRLTWSDLTGPGEPASDRAMRNTDAVMHPGWLTLLFAVLAVCARRSWPPSRRRFLWLIAAVGVVGFVMSFGDSGGLPPGSDRRLLLPFGILREVCLPFTAFRCPSRFIYLATVALAWLATSGVLALGASPVRWRRLVVWGVAAGLIWIESVPMGMRAIPLPVDGRTDTAAVESAAPGAVLVVPAPATEADETADGAFWLHRALATGQPVTDGLSGWVPPTARRLRARLQDCEAGRLAVPALLDSLRAAGIVGAEVSEHGADPRRATFWEGALESAGFRGATRAPGYRYYPFVDTADR
ncbi:MAG: hypothetical protein R3D98_06965 [Candidatus Krumholzibacteriia bacterium]